MKILVIDDKKENRESAIATLVGHEVTVASNFDEANDLLTAGMKIEKRDAIMAEMGYTKCPKDEEGRQEYLKAMMEAQDQAKYVPDFDVVLTDLLMPMVRGALREDMWDPSKEVPYGYILVMLAIRAGVKFVAVVTDMNHHHHWASAAMDHLGAPIKRADCVIMFLHAEMVMETIKDAKCWACEGSGKCTACKDEPGVCRWCHGNAEEDCNCNEGKCGNCKGTTVCSRCEGKGVADEEKPTDAKDWSKALAELMDEDEKD